MVRIYCGREESGFCLFIFVCLYYFLFLKESILSFSVNQCFLFFICWNNFLPVITISQMLLWECKQS